MKLEFRLARCCLQSLHEDEGYLGNMRKSQQMAALVTSMIANVGKERERTWK